MRLFVAIKTALPFATICNETDAAFWSLDERCFHLIRRIIPNGGPNIIRHQWSSNWQSFTYGKGALRQLLFRYLGENLRESFPYEIFLKENRIRECRLAQKETEDILICQKERNTEEKKEEVKTMPNPYCLLGKRRDSAFWTMHLTLKQKPKPDTYLHSSRIWWETGLFLHLGINQKWQMQLEMSTSQKPDLHFYSAVFLYSETLETSNFQRLLPSKSINNSKKRNIN